MRRDFDEKVETHKICEHDKMYWFSIHINQIIAISRELNFKNKVCTSKIH